MFSANEMTSVKMLDPPLGEKRHSIVLIGLIRVKFLLERIDSREKITLRGSSAFLFRQQGVHCLMWDLGDATLKVNKNVHRHSLPFIQSMRYFAKYTIQNTWFR